MLSSLFHWISRKIRFSGHPLLTAIAYILYRSRHAYLQDGFLTVHNSDFRRTPLFREAYQLGKATGSWGRQDVEWRAYIVCWAAWTVRHKEGDFVECGVNRGGYSRAVMHFIDFNSLGKLFWLLDTYDGIADQLLTPQERQHGVQAGDYDECYDSVVETFSPFPGARIVRGMIPETLSRIESEKVCYISIDMNNVTPEIAAAEYLWDRLVSGGVMILDDYGWTKQIEQKIAFDKFARERSIMILSLPTGQGLVIKP